MKPAVEKKNPHFNHVSGLPICSSSPIYYPTCFFFAQCRIYRI